MANAAEGHPIEAVFAAFGLPQNAINDKRLTLYRKVLDDELPPEAQRAAVAEVLTTWRYSTLPPLGEIVQRGKAWIQAQRAREDPPPPRPRARQSPHETRVVQQILANAQANPIEPDEAQQCLRELHDQSRKQYARDRRVCMDARDNKPLHDSDVRRVLNRGDYDLGGLAWWLRRELDRRGDPRAAWARV